MKETGIIMSGDHPRLILDGLKTMTRRTRGLKRFNEKPDDWVAHHIAGAEWEFKNIHTLADYHILCPYGGVGDRLWVRETWGALGYGKSLPIDREAMQNRLVYGENAGWQCRRSSLFMPRWASRILPEITELRAERLLEITDREIELEGIKVPDLPGSETLRHRFSRLWDSLNAKRGYPWEGNWWVWVIGFRMVERR